MIFAICPRVRPHGLGGVHESFDPEDVPGRRHRCRHRFGAGLVGGFVAGDLRGSCSVGRQHPRARGSGGRSSARLWGWDWVCAMAERPPSTACSAALEAASSQAPCSRSSGERRHRRWRRVAHGRVDPHRYRDRPWYRGGRRARRDAWLLFSDGPMRGKEFILQATQPRVGSDYRCDIVLVKDPSVAPVQAAFVRIPNGTVRR